MARLDFGILHFASRLMGIGVLMFISISCGRGQGEYEIAKIDVGQRRSIEILASYEMDIFQSFYYQVRVDDKIVVPLTMICSGHDIRTQKFTTIVAKNGDLVGVLEQRYPDEILALHDFTSNTTWPRAAANDSTDQRDKVGEELLKQLQAEHPTIRLKKGYGSGCN